MVFLLPFRRTQKILQIEMVPLVTAPNKYMSEHSFYHKFLFIFYYQHNVIMAKGLSHEQLIVTCCSAIVFYLFSSLHRKPFVLSLSDQMCTFCSDKIDISFFIFTRHAPQHMQFAIIHRKDVKK